MYNIRQLILGDLSTNCYIISDTLTKRALVIDPADSPEYIGEKLLEANSTPVAMIATHGHFDHLLGAFGLQVLFPELPLFIHHNDNFLLSRMQKTTTYFTKNRNAPPPPQYVFDIFAFQSDTVGKEKIEILSLAGHTPGSIGLYIPESHAVFVGDLLFSDGSFGDTHHTYSDVKNFHKSVEIIRALPSYTKIYPGHGDMILVGDLSYNGVYS